jgi:hypothetical protein
MFQNVCIAPDFFRAVKQVRQFPGTTCQATFIQSLRDKNPDSVHIFDSTPPFEDEDNDEYEDDCVCAPNPGVSR